jgi:hypothetical protein
MMKVLRAHAGSHLDGADGSKERFVVVREMPPVESPVIALGPSKGKLNVDG